VRFLAFALFVVGGCVYQSNGQSHVLTFSQPGPLALGDAFTVMVGSPSGFATEPLCNGASTGTLASNTPAVVTVSGVTVLGCTSATMNAVGVGHGQLAATLGGASDTLDLWVESPDHVVILSPAIGAPLHATVHVLAGTSVTLGLDVRDAAEDSLAYSSVPTLAIDSTIAVATFVPATSATFFAFPTPAHITLTGNRAGTTMLSANVFGLSDTITVAVDP